MVDNFFIKLGYESDWKMTIDDLKTRSRFEIS